MNDYLNDQCAPFCRLKDPYGGLSNMSREFPVSVNGIECPSSEHLYQAMRFTGSPRVQEKVLNAKSPMGSKIVAHEHIAHTREDWQTVKVVVMAWVLRLKIQQNWDEMVSLLLSTGEKSIVEVSKKDQFWGAFPTSDGYRGDNVLGKLLSQLRIEITDNGPDLFTEVPPPALSDFLILGKPVETSSEDDELTPVEDLLNAPVMSATHPDAGQRFLF